MSDDRADRLNHWIDAPEGPAPDDLRPLAELAADLRRALGPASPSGETRARVWARLQQQLRPAPELRFPARGRDRWLRPAHALAGVALAVMLGLGTTVAYASEASLPGDPLYALKRGLESARLALSLTESGDASLVGEFAGRRVDEIEALTGTGRWDDVERALGAYSETIAGLGEVDPEQAEAQLRHHIEVLERVRAKAPPAALPGLDRALERAGRGREEAIERRDHEKPNPAPGQEKKETATPGGDDKGPPRTPRRPGGLPPGWEKKLTPTP